MYLQEFHRKRNCNICRYTGYRVIKSKLKIPHMTCRNCNDTTIGCAVIQLDKY